MEEDVFLKRGRRKEQRCTRGPESNFINFKLGARSVRMRWLIIFPVVGSSSLGAEDDRNDSLLRTLQISPISEAGGPGEEGRAVKVDSIVAPLSVPRACTNETIVATRRARAAVKVARPEGRSSIRSTHDIRNGVRILRGTTQLQNACHRIAHAPLRCEMLINIWPGGEQS